MTTSGTKHAAERARERHGLELTARDFDRMVLAITKSVLGQRSRATFRFRQQNGVEHWDIRFAGKQRARVVYDPVGARIITVLP